jgi:BON domain
MIPYFPSDWFSQRPASTQWHLPANPPVGADEELALLVAERLRESLMGTGHRIVVEVQNRVVVLEGNVATDAIRRQVHQIVWQTPGVVDVSNRLALWGDQRRGDVSAEE